jgi:hypothetical protein
MQIKSTRLAPKKGRWPKSPRKRALGRYLLEAAGNYKKRCSVDTVPPVGHLRSATCTTGTAMGQWVNRSSAPRAQP